MSDEQERRITQPPRAFDEDAETPSQPGEGEGSPDTAGPDDAEADPSAEAEPEVIEEHAEPEEPAAFEDLSELPSLLEALLFVTDHPVDTGYLARAVEVTVPRVEHALDALAESLREGRRGIRLQRGPVGVQLVSAPEASAQVERFLGLEANRRLSQAALETLAIIAYRQPITRGQVDTVRGVSSDGAIATLRARDLIEPAGHAAGPGRPMLFRTTQRFLEHFGLERPGQLPPLPEDVDLPPAEIQAQLGLDEATILEALAPPAPTAEEPAEAEDGPVEEGAATDASEGDSGVEAPSDGERDEVDEAIEATLGAGAAGDEVDIPSDLQALSEAAEHAFEASRDRLAAGEPEGVEGTSEVREDDRESEG